MAFINPFQLTDRRILITGATSGIGYAAALMCAQMGAEVIGIGRDEARLQNTQEALEGISNRPHCMVNADLTLSADRDRVVTSLSAPINGLLHSAGISRLCPVRMMTEQHLREVQNINVEAPMLLTQGLLKQNLIAADSSIVFLASIAAHIGVPGVAAYSGTKAALIAMMRCLALEIIKRRIRANCLSPALVETPLLETAMSYLEAERKHYPLGFGKPEDVANAAVFLLSNASRWITGTTIVMDGGLTIS